MGLEEMHLVINGMHYARVDSRSSDALLVLMASYYIFDMAYSTEVKPSLLFLQAYCLMLPDQQIEKYNCISMFMNLIEHEKSENNNESSCE